MANSFERASCGVSFTLLEVLARGALLRVVELRLHEQLGLVEVHHVLVADDLLLELQVSLKGAEVLVGADVGLARLRGSDRFRVLVEEVRDLHI